MPATVLTERAAIAAAGSNVIRKGLACSFVCGRAFVHQGTKGMTNPKPGQARKASKNIGSRWTVVLLK